VSARPSGGGLGTLQLSRILEPARLLEPSHWELLALLGWASFFEGYDLNIVIFALPHIRSTYGLSQSSASLWLSLLYLGALPAIFIARRADRHGRRRVLLVSICGYTIATAATGLAPSIGVFAGCQFAARLFLAVELSLTWTVLAEELPQGARGFGFGFLATLDILGAGFGSLLYGVVLAPLGVSWRWLYGAAVPVLVVVAWLRRRLPESRRYLRVAEARTWSRWSEITRRPHARNLILVCALALLVNLTTQATVFVIDFLESQRHLSTSSANLTLVGAGALAIPVLAIAGSLSDRLGRRTVGCFFLAVGVVGLYLFFFVARGVPGLLAALALAYFGGFGSWPALGAYGTELFPTNLRALGNSCAGAAKVTGQCLGFVVAGVLIAGTQSLPYAVAVLTIGPIVAIPLVVFLLPETSGRDIDETAGETLATAVDPLGSVACG
jgi:MFS transporter, putative metabolite:H+ symporter